MPRYRLNFFKLYWGLTVHRQHSLYFQYKTILKFCQVFEPGTGNVAGFCVNRNLPYKVISGRIKANCNMRFGCCHKTVDGLALRCRFSAPCEGRFLNMKNPSIRHGERDDTMSDFEILSLVIMTAGLIVQILIYIKKKWAAHTSQSRRLISLSNTEG